MQNIQGSKKTSGVVRSDKEKGRKLAEKNEDANV